MNERDHQEQKPPTEGRSLPVRRSESAEKMRSRLLRMIVENERKRHGETTRTTVKR